MRRDPKKYLFDMQQAIDRLVRFTAGKTLQDYLEDDMLQAAVERQFEIIGEAAGQLAKVAPQTADTWSDLPRMISFRNLLVHGYASIDPLIVWGVLERDIDTLQRQVLRQLGESQ